MNPILTNQLALDYGCDPAQVLDSENHFLLYRPQAGRRAFREAEECWLKAAAVNGKLLMAGQEDIIAWCEDVFGDAEGQWFLNGRSLARLQDKLRESGHRLGSLHPYSIAETPTEPGGLPFGIRWYRGEEIEAFRGDARFHNAYTFDPKAPDVIGVGALDGDQILGMAGASRDSETMWQIGIDVIPEARGRRIAAPLVCLLKNEILRLGKLPFYSTALSHTASLRVAVAAGFRPAWAELYTAKNE